MEDSEFDKQYAAKLKKAGAPDFSEEDWGPLASTLQSKQRRRWSAMPLWWLGITAALLAGSNLFWWRMWATQQKAVDELQHTLQQNRPAPATLQHDTLTIHRFDTLYRTIYVRAIPLASFEKPGSLIPDALVFDTTTLRAQAPATSAQPGENAKLVAAPEQIQATSEPAFIQYQAGTISPAQPGTIATPGEPFQLHEFPVAFSTKHARGKFFHPEILVPKKLRIGAFCGASIPTGAGLSKTIGASTALNAELAFSERLALSLDVVYGGFDFRSNTRRTDYGFSDSDNPDDDYQLQYISTEEGWWTYAGLSVGMRYYFPGKSRWNPYVGLGYGLRWLLPTELGALYLNTQTGNTKVFSIENESYSPSANYVDTELGLRYRLWKRLYWQSAGKFQYKANKNQAGMPQYWELRTGAMWAF